MYGPSTHRGSFKYDGMGLDEYVTPTAHVLPPPPQQPFQPQPSDYIHPMTRRDDELNENLQRALDNQGYELSKLQYHVSKMIKKQRKERSALLQHIYSLQDRECDPPTQKTNIFYIIIVLLVILIVLVIVSLTRKRSNTDLQTLLTLVQLLDRRRTR